MLKTPQKIVNVTKEEIMCIGNYTGKVYTVDMLLDCGHMVQVGCFSLEQPIPNSTKINCDKCEK